MAVTLSGCHAFCGTADGVVVVEISESENAQVVAEVSSLKTAEDIAVRNGYAYIAAAEHGLQIYRITELPAITRQSVTGNMLNLQWNEPAKGMKLQRATSLTNPDWRTLTGSEAMQNADLPVWGGQEYFRLAFNGPDNMVWIEPGTFMMGSPEDEQDRMDNEGPQTEVTLTQGFFIGKYEVTQGEYEAAIGGNPSYFTGDSKRPVETVNWNDAVDFCSRLTQQERAAGRLPVGYEYRLPTEAQWEYACRAGMATRFSFGDALESDDRCGYSALMDSYVNWCGNGISRPERVGSKLPSRWGLHDMHGNVWEWCADWYGTYSGGEDKDPAGPVSGLQRVIRGGDWSNLAKYVRTASRRGDRPDVQNSYIGFRVALVPVP